MLEPAGGWLKEGGVDDGNSRSACRPSPEEEEEEEGKGNKMPA